MNLNNKKLFVAVFGVISLVIILGSVDLSSNIDKQLAAARAAKKEKDSPNFARPSNMMIRGNGEVQLSGVTVESNDGSQLVAVGTFNQVPTNVFINTENKTKVFAGGSDAGLEALTPGTSLTVNGTLESLSPSLTIMAKEIRAFGVRMSPQTKSALMSLRNVPELPARKMLAVADTPQSDAASFLSSVINDLFEPAATTSDAGGSDTATSTGSDSATSTDSSTSDSASTATSTEPAVDPEASTTEQVIEESVEEPEEETSTTTQPVELEPSE